MDSKNEEKTVCLVGAKFASSRNLVFSATISLEDLVPFVDQDKLLKVKSCSLTNKYCSECVSDIFHSGSTSAKSSICEMRAEIFNCLKEIEELPFSDPECLYWHLWSERFLGETLFYVKKSDIIWKSIFSPDWARTPGLGVLRFRHNTKFLSETARVRLFSLFLLKEGYPVLKDVVLPITLVARENINLKETKEERMYS